VDVKSLIVWRDVLVENRPDRVADIAELNARIEEAGK